MIVEARRSVVKVRQLVIRKIREVRRKKGWRSRMKKIRRKTILISS